MKNKHCKYCGELLETEKEINRGFCDICKERKEAISDVVDRRSINVELKAFDHFAHDGDFIEITEWTNGEGVDLIISEREKEKYIPLTWGQLEALVNVAHKLVIINNYNDDEEE